MERFFFLRHLTRKQLHSLFLEACEVGRLIVEYDRPFVQEYYQIELSHAEILKNIAVTEHNYLVYHKNFDGLPDAITVGFPLTGHEHTTAYVEVENARLNDLAVKYNPPAGR